MDISRPDDLPSFLQFLAAHVKPEVILHAINEYRQFSDPPPHDLFPYEYIEALDYIEVIDNFENLILYELDRVSNTNKEGEA